VVNKQKIARSLKISVAQLTQQYTWLLELFLKVVCIYMIRGRVRSLQQLLITPAIVVPSTAV